MVGQDAVNIAGTFNEQLEISGVILTKLDGDTRGGAALSIRSVTGKPIKYVGTGEKLDDLDVFHPDRMASRILGMGDVLSLIEKAENELDEKAAEETAKRLMENKFDMNDLLEQFKSIKKMGSVKSLLSMMPGMEKQVRDADIDERQFDRIQAIITSMTAKERAKPEIINGSRRKRIAAGCGQSVEDVNRLLRQYEQIKKMMKQMNKTKNGRRMGGFNMPGGFPMM
jgi:signal recognition particle subunit SRP54